MVVHFLGQVIVTSCVNKEESMSYETIVLEKRGTLPFSL